jgi:hypothetical protein
MNAPADAPGNRHLGNRRLRAVAVVTGTLGILTLAACSGSSTPSTPTGSATAAPITATSGRPSPTSSATYRPADPKGLGAQVQVSGPAGAGTDEQRAIEAVWSRYWEVRFAAFNSRGGTLDPTFSSLDAVATGKARSNVILGSSNRLKKGMYTVGTAQFTVTSVDVRGNAAVVHACAHDRSYEINDKGETVVPAPGDAPIADQLTRTPDGWRVSDTPAVPGACAAGS